MLTRLTVSSSNSETRLAPSSQGLLPLKKPGCCISTSTSISSRCARPGMLCSMGCCSHSHCSALVMIGPSRAAQSFFPACNNSCRRRRAAKCRSGRSTTVLVRSGSDSARSRIREAASSKISWWQETRVTGLFNAMKTDAVAVRGPACYRLT